MSKAGTMKFSQTLTKLENILYRISTLTRHRKGSYLYPHQTLIEMLAIYIVEVWSNPHSNLIVPYRTFENVATDIVSTLSVSSRRSYHYMLTFINICTTWSDVISLRYRIKNDITEALMSIFYTVVFSETLLSEMVIISFPKPCSHSHK